MQYPEEPQDPATWTERELIMQTHHELNQAVTSVRGFLSVLQDTRVGLLNPQQEEIVRHLDRNIDLIVMVNETLHLWIRAHRTEKDER